MTYKELSEIWDCGDNEFSGFNFADSHKETIAAEKEIITGATKGAELTSPDKNKAQGLTPDEWDKEYDKEFADKDKILDCIEEVARVKNDCFDMLVESKKKDDISSSERSQFCEVLDKVTKKILCELSDILVKKKQITNFQIDWLVGKGFYGMKKEFEKINSKWCDKDPFATLLTDPKWYIESHYCPDYKICLRDYYNPSRTITTIATPVSEFINNLEAFNLIEDLIWSIGKGKSNKIYKDDDEKAYIINVTPLADDIDIAPEFTFKNLTPTLTPKSYQN